MQCILRGLQNARESLVLQVFVNDHSPLKLPGIQYCNFILNNTNLMPSKKTKQPTTTTTTTTTTSTSPEKPKKQGHKGNNGLRGKPSNNLGKTRKQKLPRRSKLDMELQKEDQTTGEDSDKEENLEFNPISAHMYRSKFIKLWVSKLVTQEIPEDSVISKLLGHGQAETNCIMNIGETPSCATVDHLRKNIKVKGKPYKLPPVRSETDRNIRPYHFWMYNSGRFTREQLAQMSGKQEESAKGVDSINASHTCGGTCLNHAIPEPNSLNQGRKKHHAQMLAALENADVEKYKKLREECQHHPKCFINPGPRRYTEILKSKCPDYKNILYSLE